jgi:oligopeptide/dipeptide ABC transporter ATP-binding protein
MSETESPLLEVKNLRVEFRPADGPPAVAVDGLSFALNKGEGLAVMGESGSGKTATALAISGLLPACARTSGEIIFEDNNLLEMSEARMARHRGARIGYVFQEPSSALNPVISVGEQVAETARAHGKEAKLARHNALAALSSAGFPDAEQRYDSFPHEFSGGLRQRACIAMAIVNRPALLIADEPTSALDVSVQAGIIDLLADLRRGFEMALIFITHDLSIAPRVAERGLIMYAGRPVELAPVEDLLARPLHPYTRALLAAAPNLGQGRGRLNEIPGSVPSASEKIQGCRFAARCQMASAECRERTPALIEVVSGHFVSCFCAGHSSAGNAPLPEIKL